MLKAALILVFPLFSLPFSSFAGEKALGYVNRLPTEAVESLGKGAEFVLYSLDPGPITFLPTPRLKAGESLDGFKILGRLALTDPKSRAIAVSAFTEAIQAADIHFIAMCFRPRHALRVTANGKVFDFIICYECGRLKLFQDGVLVGAIGIPSAPEPLNKLLSAAGIPLAAQDPVK